MENVLLTMITSHKKVIKQYRKRKHSFNLTIWVILTISYQNPLIYWTWSLWDMDFWHSKPVIKLNHTFWASTNSKIRHSMSPPDGAICFISTCTVCTVFDRNKQEQSSFLRASNDKQVQSDVPDGKNGLWLYKLDFRVLLLCPNFKRVKIVIHYITANKAVKSNEPSTVM